MAQTTKTQTAYTANINAAYILNGESTVIKSEYIKYVVTEYIYSSRYMPVIYMSMAVNNDLYNKIINNEKSGKIYLNIQKANAFSNLSIGHDDIKDQFTYSVSTSNPNYSEDLASGESNLTTSYKVVTVALMSMKLLNAAKTSFNGIFGNIDQSTLIMKIMENTSSKLIIKQPEYNPRYDTIIIPPLNSREKLIKYLYQKCPFYDTNYVFFMDFSRSYLMDLSGVGIPGETGNITNINISINGATDNRSYTPGIRQEGNTYILNVNPANTNISLNKGTDKVSNQLVFVQDNGQVKSVNLNINNNTDSTTKQSFRRGGNAILYKNIAESNTIITEIVKENIDGSIFSPNNGYYIKNQASYASYDGAYTLLYKKEVIKNVEGTFGISVCLGLKKVGNITKLGSAIVTAAEKSSSFSSGKIYTTTSKNNASAKNSNILKTPNVKHIKAQTEDDNLLIKIPHYDVNY